MVAPTKEPASQTTQGPDHLKVGRVPRQSAIIMASASKAGAGQFIGDFTQKKIGVSPQAISATTMTSS
jgi:ABC-type enterochelin transport system permease subunit